MAERKARRYVRLSLAIVYLAAGILHLTNPAPFFIISPQWVPQRSLVIALTGLCEIAASLLAARHGVIPKTLNFATPDVEQPLHVVHGEHLASSNGLFLKTSVTRVGQASAVVIQA